MHRMQYVWYWHHISTFQTASRMYLKLQVVVKRSTYGYTRSNGQNNETHDVCVNAKDTSCPWHQGHHPKGQGRDPQHRHEETYHVIFSENKMLTYFNVDMLKKMLTYFDPGLHEFIGKQFHRIHEILEWQLNVFMEWNSFKTILWINFLALDVILYWVIKEFLWKPSLLYMCPLCVGVCSKVSMDKLPIHF